ncbi:MAG: methyltransferase domain-containing protein [Planctomycetes bacterium]|nr:methyltransferase domain-containing protein [Planctomycetota bacterium]
MSAPTQPADRPSEDYYSSYADPGVHRLMLMDRVRTDAYRQAIRQLVGEESIVLDVGSGTGILSLFAAQAGAKEVHAAEASDMIHMAERIADANSLHGPIRFHKGPVEALELDKPVSILVSEWMGYFALAECMFESVLIARDKHLAPGGVMVPSHVDMLLAPVEDSRLDFEHGFGFWEAPVFGFDFRELGDYERCDPLLTAPGVPFDALLGPACLLTTLDCQQGTSESFWFDVKRTLTIERQGMLHGFAGWFDAHLAPGVCLSTGPEAALTHWRQSFFPMRTTPVCAGDVLEVALRATRRPHGDTRLPIYFLEAELRREGRLVDSFFYRYYGSFE